MIPPPAHHGPAGGRGAPRRLAGAAALGVLAALLALAPSAAAAELVAGAPAELAIIQGQVASVTIRVSAEGPIDCLTGRDHPARAIIDTSYSVLPGPGPPATGRPSARLGFYSDGRSPLLPPTCGVTWDTSPVPYRVPVTFAVGAETPVGDYRVRLQTRVENPGFMLAPLVDGHPTEVVVKVAPRAPNPPPSEPPPLPGPRENVSVNLLPGRGNVFVRYPGARRSRRVRVPTQIPPGTVVDAADGYVSLLSDQDGRGRIQSGTFWDGKFAVSYSRSSTPDEGRRARAGRPFTELALKGSAGPCRRKSPSARAARRRSPGVWGSGKGRFRTRGAYGAGTVRGTRGFTSNTCEGTLFRVTQGRLAVRDFVVDRTVSVPAGTGYLARRPGGGHTRG